MLVAQKAVDNKIKSVKSGIGNTITISPAAFNPGSSTNNALSTDDLKKVESLNHVSSITKTLQDSQATTGSSNMPFLRGPGGDNSSSTTTSLTSPVTIDGPRFMSGGGSDTSVDTSSFHPPVIFLGTNTPGSVRGSSISLVSGKSIAAGSDTNNVMISQAMANKNNLKVGDTFTAYNATLTVAGIFKTDNEGTRNTVVLSLGSLQRLTGQSGVITDAVVTVDSLDNLSSVTDAVKDKLGDNADVTSAEEKAENTVKPLNSVKTVSTFSLIGSLVAGAVIILLTMIMVVRERKKEIGVVKAIGSSNLRIVSEFMVESLTLAIAGAVIGLLIGVIGGQPVTKALVESSTSSNTSSIEGPGGRTLTISKDDSAGPQSPGGGGMRRSFGQNGAVQGLKNINAQIGWNILLQGFGAAVLISVIGSMLAAGMIAKVRPSTIMRAE